jgi:hypothetical protein
MTPLHRVRRKQQIIKALMVARRPAGWRRRAFASRGRTPIVKYATTREIATHACRSAIALAQSASSPASRTVAAASRISSARRLPWRITRLKK